MSASSTGRSGHNVEQPLRDAVARLVRCKAGGSVALVLHLSRLRPPAPRPHHRRIARAVLDDAAARQGGQVFPLSNADSVLLWRANDAGTALAETLAGLFRVDAPDPNALLTRWLLPEEAEPFLAYLDFCEQEAAARPLPPMTPEAAPTMTTLEAMSAVVENARITDLLHRQTAVRITHGGTRRLMPLYREITFSIALLEARAEPGGHPTADPFLLRHLTERVDRRMLQALADDVRGPGRLAGWACADGPALHINLTLPAILSASFAAFAAACNAAHARVAVEIGLVEAFADPEGFLAARERLRLAGLGFVLDAVSHQAMLMTAPTVLMPDLVKLEWSPRCPEAGPPLEATLRAIDVRRIVLHRADTEEALRWGLQQGIRRFQGRHVDAMLAAGRIENCASAASCTLRQCIERESATGTAGRAGCRNLPLLDAGAPGLVVAA